MDWKSQYFKLKKIISLPGTKDWLIGTEIEYGGMVSNIFRKKASPKDPRSKKQLNQGGMRGGDRMLYLNYAAKYAQYLDFFVKNDHKITIAEFGILQGTGLAIWCDLFPNGKILGFDIDLSYMKNNLSHLKKLGAFKYNQPKLYELDMYMDNTKLLGKILLGEKIDIAIDDGVHDRETIINTIKSVLPYLADNFVYFIEDNGTIHQEIRLMYPNLKIDNKGLLTIVSKLV